MACCVPPPVRLTGSTRHDHARRCHVVAGDRAGGRWPRTGGQPPERVDHDLARPGREQGCALGEGLMGEAEARAAAATTGDFALADAPTARAAVHPTTAAATTAAARPVGSTYAGAT